MNSSDKLDLLKKDIPIGTKTIIHLTSGTSINGSLDEIGPGFIILTDTDNKKQRLFSPMIGGWEMASCSPDATDDNDNHNQEKAKDVLEAIKAINAIYAKDSYVTIVTNATITSVSTTAVKVITDNQREIQCIKRYIAGYSKKVAIPGARLFCKPHRTKEYCSLGVMEMSYEEMMRLLEKATSNKPEPPIINSIVSYYKVNHNDYQTKPILKKIPVLKETTDTSADSTLNLHEILNNISREVAAGNVSKALESLDFLLTKTIDIKQKATILLRKAQIYSSIKQYEEAISAYSELIEFNIKNHAPSNSIAHYYAELARLYTVVNDLEKAEEVSSIALAYKSDKTDTEVIVTDAFTDSSSASKSNTSALSSFVQLKPIDMSPVHKRLVDDDIEHHAFFDPEVKSLKGAINLDIANKLIEKAKGSEKPEFFLEVAKALKSLPAGSYAYQDYEDAVINYAITKSELLYSSFCSIIQSATSIDSLSVEQLTKIKDCAICYYREAIDYVSEDNEKLTWSLFFDVIKLELAEIAVNNNSAKKEIIAILENNDINNLASTKDHDTLISVILSTMSLAARCNNLWDKQLKDSEFIRKINSRLDNKTKIALLSAEVTEKANRKVSVHDKNFLFELIQWERNFIHTFNNRFNKFTGTPLNLYAMESLEKCFKGLDKAKFTRCISTSDKKTIGDIRHAIGILSLYKSSDATSRKTILSNSIKELNDIILWNNDPTTVLGRFMFAPTMKKWIASLSKMESPSKVIDCALTLSLDPPYLLDKEKSKKSFSVIIHNPNEIIADGFRLCIWKGDAFKEGFYKNESKVILPKTNITISIPIKNDWGDGPVFELNYTLCSLHKESWSKEVSGSITLSKKRDIKKNLVLKWKEQGDVPSGIYKGRDEIVDNLKEHYCSDRKYYSYVLYGLSRTGKSCILHNLGRKICGSVIQGPDSSRRICPVYIDLGEVESLSSDNTSFWRKFLSVARLDAIKNCKTFAPELAASISVSKDFDEFVSNMNEIGFFPLFMFDEFSVMKEIIDKGFINTAFLQYMRTLSADKNLASFIFAGTYDIKDLIYDSSYNIAGAFPYIIKPKKPVFEISMSAAEELITVMQDSITFTPAAIREIHRLSGDVPYWIQKICLNSGYYAISNNKPDIGLAELDTVIKQMVGEQVNTEDDLSKITHLGEETFIKTQILTDDPEEFNLILTSVAFLMRHNENPSGVSYEQMKNLWRDYDVFDAKYDIPKAINLLEERHTITKESRDEQTYYRFSLDLFRRWWDINHFDIDLQLSSFNTNK